MRNPIVAALIVASSLSAGCAGTETKAVQSEAKAAPVEQPAARFTDLSRPKVGILNAAVRDIPGVVNATLRVRPDRRVVIAAGDVHELLTRSKGKVSIDFGSDGWTLRVDQKVAGTLPELPTFGEGLALLTRFASQGGRRENAASDAHAATLLTVRTPDRVGITDPLGARALALVAIARAAEPVCCADDVALLAEIFGYETEARELARKLPAGSAARAYVLRTKGAGDDPFSQWVSRRSRLLIPKHDSERETLIERELSAITADAMPLLNENPSFSMQAPLARATARLVAAEVAGETVGTTEALETAADLDDLLDKFERHVQTRARAVATPTLPEELMALHYTARFLSAAEQELRFALDARGVAAEAQEVARKLDGATAPVIRQSAEWMRMRIAAKFSKGGATPADVAIARVPMLSGGTRAALVRQYAKSAGGYRTDVRRALWEIYPELDSRPAEMLLAGDLSHTIHADPSRRDRYAGTAVERTPRGAASMRSWYYAAAGNIARLKEIAASPEAESDDRGYALQMLAEKPGADDAFIRSSFERLLDEDRRSGMYSMYMRVLNDRGDAKAKERVARRMLARIRPGDHLEGAYYASSLADALERQGRYDEAWAIVEPWMPTWTANIIQAGVSLLQRRGRNAEAEKLGEQMIERYPDAVTRTDFAAALWRMRKYREAAAVLDPKEQYSSAGLYEFPEIFTNTFAREPVADAVAAFRELAATGFASNTLIATVERCTKLGLHELAATLAVQVCEMPANRPAAVAPVAVAYHITAWKALRDWKGVEAANAWLRTRLPDEAVLQLAVIAHQNNADELLWTFVTPRPDVHKNLQVQSILSAAAVKLRVPHDDPRFVSLASAVRAHPETAGSLLPVSRYMLDLADETSVDAWPTDADGRTALAYFKGVKLAAEGEHEKALPWLIAALYGKDSQPPGAWALTLLTKWSSASMRWADVAKNRL